MTFSSALTLITDTLITMTLFYCIILERRIRAFRKQEQAFRVLIDDVSESTRAAQGAVSSLRHLMDELGQRSRSAQHGPQPAPADPHRRSDASPRSGDVDTPLSVLAARVAAMRTKLDV